MNPEAEKSPPPAGSEKGEAEPGLEAYAALPDLDPASLRFSWSEGGFLSLVLNPGEAEEKSYGRVHLHRCYPFTEPSRYISVRDKDNKEIGMILDLGRFPAPVRALLDRELERRYFLPRIVRIDAVREEFGYSYWQVLTSAGPRSFAVRSGQGNVYGLSEAQVMVVDVDGNRYRIEDYSALDAKSLKMVETLLA